LPKSVKKREREENLSVWPLVELASDLDSLSAEMPGYDYGQQRLSTGDISYWYC